MTPFGTRRVQLGGTAAAFWSPCRNLIRKRTTKGLMRKISRGSLPLPMGAKTLLPLRYDTSTHQGLAMGEVYVSAPSPFQDERPLSPSAESPRTGWPHASAHTYSTKPPPSPSPCKIATALVDLAALIMFHMTVFHCLCSLGPLPVPLALAYCGCLLKAS